jgi:hypothetical protein
LLPKILADENVDNRIVSSLRASKINILSIMESYPGISDREVVELARNNNSTDNYSFLFLII